jgi:hypothetical protein
MSGLGVASCTSMAEPESHGRDDIHRPLPLLRGPDHPHATIGACLTAPFSWTGPDIQPPTNKGAPADRPRRLASQPPRPPNGAAGPAGPEATEERQLCSLPRDHTANRSVVGALGCDARRRIGPPAGNRPGAMLAHIPTRDHNRASRLPVSSIRSFFSASGGALGPCNFVPLRYLLNR